MSKVVVSLREAVRLMREELRRRWTLSPSGRYAVPSPMGMLSPKGMLLLLYEIFLSKGDCQSATKWYAAKEHPASASGQASGGSH